MKKNKGFTLVEVIISFSLIMVVMIYLIKTVMVANSEETDLITEQQFAVYQSMLLEKIYGDIGSAVAISVSTDENKITILSSESSLEKILIIDDNSIIYDNTIYELPDNCEFNNEKYSLVSDENYYILKINIKVNGKNKIMKIIIQN